MKCILIFAGFIFSALMVYNSLDGVIDLLRNIHTHY